MAGWPDGQMAGWLDGRMAGWPGPDGRVSWKTEWPDGQIAGWSGGRMAKLSDGCVARWPDSWVATACRWSVGRIGGMARWPGGRQASHATISPLWVGLAGLAWDGRAFWESLEH